MKTLCAKHANAEGIYIEEEAAKAGIKVESCWTCEVCQDEADQLNKNSERGQRELTQQAKDTPKNEVWAREETTRFTLADLLKEYVEENNPLTDKASMYTDLLNAAISEVNWNEIAGNILSEK